MYTIVASDKLFIRAAAARVFAVLIDYENYPQIFDMVQSVQVHARDEGVCSVSFSVDSLVHIECTLRFVEDAPTSLRFTRTDANLLQHLTGSWTLIEEASSFGCTLEYALEVKLAGQIPRATENRLLTQRLPAMLEGLRVFIERHNVA